MCCSDQINKFRHRIDVPGGASGDWPVNVYSMERGSLFSAVGMDVALLAKAVDKLATEFS